MALKDHHPHDACSVHFSQHSPQLVTRDLPPFNVPPFNFALLTVKHAFLALKPFSFFSFFFFFFVCFVRRLELGFEASLASEASDALEASLVLHVAMAACLWRYWS